MYLVGDRMFEIPVHVVQQFIEWNTNAVYRSNIAIDGRYVRALLLVLVTKQELVQLSYKAEIIEFIRRKLKTHAVLGRFFKIYVQFFPDLLICRTNGDSKRVDALETMIDEYRHQLGAL